MKIRHKITLLFALLVTAILLLVSFSVYYFFSLQREEVFSTRLKSRASYNAQLYSIITENKAAILERVNSSASGLLPKKSVAVFDVQGHLLYHFRSAGADSIVLDAEQLQKVIGSQEYLFQLGSREAIGYFEPDSDRSRIFIVAAYDEDGWLRLEQLKHIFIISILVGIVLSLLVGYLFSRQLLTPVTRMISEVNDISSQNLTTRIHSGKSHDEMTQLAQTFNNLLSRLDDSFTTQRRFISNASHELSTPLTSISSQLQVTLQRERSSEEYRQVMRSVLEDVQQMLQLTKSLLEIAKTGSQGGIELKEVRIDEVLFKAISDVRKVNVDYKVDLNFGELPENDEGFYVYGNSDLLYISIKNIIENGCKFSVDQTSMVDLSFLKDELVIQVKNQGDVIAEKEAEHIFQPFYRSAATSKVPGFGLGLALARRIVSLHKGRINVTSNDITGTVFSIYLPSYKPAGI